MLYVILGLMAYIAITWILDIINLLYFDTFTDEPGIRFMLTIIWPISLPMLFTYFLLENIGDINKNLAKRIETRNNWKKLQKERPNLKEDFLEMMVKKEKNLSYREIREIFPSNDVNVLDLFLLELLKNGDIIQNEDGWRIKSPIDIAHERMEETT